MALSFGWGAKQLSQRVAFKIDFKFIIINLHV